MGLLDDILNLKGGFNPQAFMGPGYETVWSQLKPWLARISTHGVVKWVPRAASQMPCGIPQYENGFPVGPCSNHAIDSCLCCGRPICLSHAFIEGTDATAVCFLCVVQMRDRSANPAGAPPPRQEQRQAPPPDTKKADAEQKAWWARGVLFIQEGAPWAAVKKQYKTLSAQYHPDKVGGDEKRFKEIQSAYDIMKLIYGEN